MRVTSTKARFVGGVLYEPGHPFEWPWEPKADMLPAPVEAPAEAPARPVKAPKGGKAAKSAEGPRTLSEITKTDSDAQAPKGAADLI